MRPLQLRMRAFGPFAEAQEVDFTALGERSLFLIHGPTGAGKSSILDAISFALYGQSSGGERGAHEVRSHHAAPDEATEVELVFSVGETAYRVTRAPEQERPKKRGEGTTTEAARAELHRLCTGSGDGGDWQPVATGSAAVTAEVERILGFEVTQFRQVVVLPQGQFRRLLSAGSDEREKILSVLFQTHEYARIQEALRREAAALRRRLELLETESRTILEKEGAESVEDVRQQLGELRREEQESVVRMADLRAAEEVLAGRWDRARGLAKHFDDLERAELELDELGQRRPQQEARRRTLDRARRASALGDLVREWATKVREVERRRTEVEGLETRHQEAAAALAEARAALALEEERGPELETARRRLEELEALSSRAERLNSAQSELDTAEAEHLVATGQVQAVSAKLEELRTLHRAVQRQHDEAQKAASGLDACRLRLEEARALVGAAEELARIEPELTSLRRELQAANQKLEQAAVELDREKIRLADLRAAAGRAHAALLAEDLTAGERCPVCGSTEHPAPAVRDPEAPTERALAEADAEVGRLAEARDRLQGEASELGRREAALEERVRAARERLRDHAGTGVEALRLVAAGAERELEEAAGADAAVEGLEQQLVAVASDLERSTGLLAELEAEVRKIGSQAAEQRGVVAELRQGLPEGLRDPGALVAESETVRARLDGLRTALEAAQTRRSKARQEAARAEERLIGQRDELERAREARGGIEAELERRLEEAGFVDRADLEDAILDPEEVAALETEHQVYESAVASAEQLRDRAARATADQARPDLGAFERELQSLRGELEAETLRQGAVSERVGGKVRSLEELDRRSGRAADLERRFEVVGTLAEVANDRAMPFERFVLATMLDEVLAAASERLMAMSRNRYLMRRDLERRDRRRSGGLDLVVFDAHTGVERSVATLSGGEGFLASLSLALGLADVVQSYSGGIRLDTMFVDEGFGSLDPEALDLAVNTLVDLNQEGRLVGIISHVPDLRERVDARLEVSRTDRGSCLRLRL